MKCLHCDSEKFTIKSILLPVEIRNKTITVESEASVCLNCNEPMMDSKQMHQLRLRSADEYKRMHGWLQSHEIRAIRHRLQMSQQTLGEMLDISGKKLNKYETYYVQSRKIDDALRKL